MNLSDAWVPLLDKLGIPTNQLISATIELKVDKVPLIVTTHYLLDAPDPELITQRFTADEPD